MLSAATGAAYSGACRHGLPYQQSWPAIGATVKAVRAWLRANPQFEATSPLLPNCNGKAMTRSNVTKRLVLAARAAAGRHSVQRAHCRQSFLERFKGRNLSGAVTQRSYIRASHRPLRLYTL
jgi:hypothetical protein